MKKKLGIDKILKLNSLPSLFYHVYCVHTIKQTSRQKWPIFGFACYHQKQKISTEKFRQVEKDSVYIEQKFVEKYFKIKSAYYKNNIVSLQMLTEWVASWWIMRAGHDEIKMKVMYDLIN